MPVTKTWRLNERHYGALQGYNKDTAYQELGLDQELVMEIRRSYSTPPPRMSDDHPYWHGRDRRYGKLSADQLERNRGESLEDATRRIMQDHPLLQLGRRAEPARGKLVPGRGARQHATDADQAD